MSQTQIRCGELKPYTQDGAKGFIGEVRLIGRLAGELKLLPHELKGRSEGSPDFEVFYKDASGTVFPIGSSWLKNDSRVQGGDFLSLTLAHPDWSSDLSLAAFPGDGGKFRLVWSRPRGQRQGDQAAP